VPAGDNDIEQKIKGFGMRITELFSSLQFYYGHAFALAAACGVAAIGAVVYKLETKKNHRLLAAIEKLQSEGRVIEITNFGQMKGYMDTAIFVEKAPCFHPVFYFVDESGKKDMMARKRLVALAQDFDFGEIPGDISERIERVGSGALLKRLKGKIK